MVATDTIMKIKVGELIEDFGLYPRSQVDGVHVQDMVFALDAGEVFPNILIDEKSKRIVDGIHRERMYLRVFGPDAEIEVVARKYSSEKEMYLDALRLNARHGSGIKGAEKTGAILKGLQLKISENAIASSLGITVERIKEILQTKVGKVRYAKGPEGKIPLKRCVYHLKVVTPKQAEAMDMLPGQSQVLLLRQLNKLIETDSINMDNPQVVEELVRLRDALNEMDLG